ncbi:unnamed protein product [Rotaria sp. Silwood2]|nr:unnamed protein product [Rotaria sp. Silwood2]
MMLSRNEPDFGRYRDPNVTQNFKSTLMHDSQELLQVPARNVGEYARNLLKILFTHEELAESLLPSPQAHRYSKKKLDEAIQTRYRITNYHYPTFYKEQVQETLAACLYNEGPRKSNKQTMQQRQPQQNTTVQNSTPSEQ